MLMVPGRLQDLRKVFRTAEDRNSGFLVSYERRYLRLHSLARRSKI